MGTKSNGRSGPLMGTFPPPNSARASPFYLPWLCAKLHTPDLHLWNRGSTWHWMKCGSGVEQLLHFAFTTAIRIHWWNSNIRTLLQTDVFWPLQSVKRKLKISESGEERVNVNECWTNTAKAKRSWQLQNIVQPIYLLYRWCTILLFFFFSETYDVCSAFLHTFHI